MLVSPKLLQGGSPASFFWQPAPDGAFPGRPPALEKASFPLVAPRRKTPIQSDKPVQTDPGSFQNDQSLNRSLSRTGAASFAELRPPPCQGPRPLRCEYRSPNWNDGLSR